MELTMYGRQLKLTEAIKGYVGDKLSKLDKYLNPNSEVKVTVSAKKDIQKVEVTVIPINGPILRAEEIQDDLYAAIDIVSDKLQRQLIKYKNRLRDKTKNNESIRFDNIDLTDENLDYENFEDDIVINRRKKFNVKPMSAEEAILQMDLIGHDFYMFRNQDSFEVNIVYKRESGGYGLIEHE